MADGFSGGVTLDPGAALAAGGALGSALTAGGSDAAFGAGSSLTPAAGARATSRCSAHTYAPMLADAKTAVGIAHLSQPSAADPATLLVAAATFAVPTVAAPPSPASSAWYARSRCASLGV